MKNVKLKIKNGSVDDDLGHGESPMKSGANDVCATPGLGVDAVVPAGESVLGEELEKGENGEKANENTSFQF